MAPLLPLSFVNLAGRSGSGASSGGKSYEPLSQQPSTPIEKANLRTFPFTKVGSSSSSSSSSSNSGSPSRPGTRLLSALIHLAVIGFAAFGVASLVEEKLGRLVRVHRLTTEQLSQTGWERQPLVVSAHDDILSNNNNNIHDPASESSSSSSSNEKSSSAVFRDFSLKPDTPASIDQQHLLILTPCRNCADTLERYFQLVTALDHPKQQTSIGFLVSDETDGTVDLMTDFIAAHQDDYRRMTLLRKDFTIPEVLEGAARHSAYLQDQRRQIMAKARTFLVSSTLEPSVDWVLWLDSDIVDMPSSLFEDLLVYGNAGVGEQPNDTAAASHTGEVAPSWDPAYDIITPNIFTRSASSGHLTGYDMNNWAETSSSIAMKSSLSADAVLVEGNILHPTGRLHLADVYHSSNYSEAPDFLPSEIPPLREGINRFDPESPAYIGRRLPLDGVGGVSTLVRATAHRVGGIFPAFVVDHQVETEGFAVLARTLGARICGLPNYGVLHASRT